MLQVRNAQHSILDGHIPAATPQESYRPRGESSATEAQSPPLAAPVTCRGVNFSLYSRDASRIELLLFDREDDAKPSRVIPLDPSANRTYHYWHVHVPTVQPGQLYG